MTACFNQAIPVLFGGLVPEDWKEGGEEAYHTPRQLVPVAYGVVGRSEDGAVSRRVFARSQPDGARQARAPFTKKGTTHDGEASFQQAESVNRIDY